MLRGCYTGRHRLGPAAPAGGTSRAFVAKTICSANGVQPSRTSSVAVATLRDTFRRPIQEHQLQLGLASVRLRDGRVRFARLVYAKRNLGGRARPALVLPNSFNPAGAEYEAYYQKNFSLHTRECSPAWNRPCGQLRRQRPKRAIGTVLSCAWTRTLSSRCRPVAVPTVDRARPVSRGRRIAPETIPRRTAAPLRHATAGCAQAA